MNLIETPLKDCFVLEPKIFGDERGFFFESFNQKVFNQVTNTNYNFVQDNHSRSAKGVLRGLHFQLAQPQGKLVRAIAGEVFDVAVDLRKSSSSFGKWFGIHLSAENKKMLWVPPGFGHGFVVQSDAAEVLYKTTDYYNPAAEKCLIWNDSDLKILWPHKDLPILSDKDKKGLNFKDVKDILGFD